MRSDFEVYNDPDVINAQFGNAALAQGPLLSNQAIGGAITDLGGAKGPAVTITTSGASGFSVASSAAGNQLTLSVTITNAATARGGLGAAAKASPAIVGAVIPLAKITGGGVDGSITVNAEGIVTAYVAPT